MSLILTILFFLSGAAHAAETFSIAEVKVECGQSENCTQRRIRFQSLIGDYRSLVHLKNTLRIMASDGGYQNFSYNIEEADAGHQLNIFFKMKSIISEINIGFKDRIIEADPVQLLTIREGEFYESQKLKENMEQLGVRLGSLGFPHNTHSFEVIDRDDKVTVNVVVTLGKPRIFKGIKAETSSEYLRSFLQNKFLNLYNKPFEFNKFKIYLDDAQKELFQYGYYLINLDFNPIIKNDRVTLDIKVTNEQLYAFDFENLVFEDRDVIHQLIKDLFRKYKRPLSINTMKLTIKDHYRSRALLNVDLDIVRSEFPNMYNETVRLYRITLDEKYKTRLTQVSFSGNSFFPRDQLERMFHREAFELASLKYFDQEYFNYFADYLRSNYIKHGYVQAKIIGPTLNFDFEKKSTTVEYVIQEGQRAIIRNISFEGMPPEYENLVIKELASKEGEPFDPVAFVEDIKKVAHILQEKGYYYAEVTNANDEKLVSYSKSGTNVDVNFQINPGKVLRLNRILYLGNNKTRKKVLVKKINIEKDEFLTPTKTREIESAISATGLFNSVSVTPLKHTSKREATDLLIKVSEREYGLIEVAPGFRSDLGIKLTGTVSYLNIGGAHRSITLREQLNQRTNFQTLDPTRRKEGKHLLEYNTSLNYTQGDIFNTEIDYGAGITHQRKRFYSFDADILRLNNTLTRDLSKKLSASLRYQYETITQYAGTGPQDNGSFRIGSITPSLTWDLRASQINPLKGAFFNLSCEFANPYFLSQKNEDLTVNYYKLISRNRFYFPFRNGTVAVSMVAGVQENLAKDKVTSATGTQLTEGYIPNIKVFRLTGLDNVRGFSDEEINRLNTGQDVSKTRVDDKAYLTNFKLEPRYFLNDAVMAGVFFDAGRVSINTVDFGDIRSSAGLTFKIITPVGTLDFDYGIKLLRKRNASGTLEDPGRFHVSIGFF
ncbi:MAG TPA: POTRA domain-containing protein [Bacteriovoracaceae bacterium]|nr:POTRA domain-containing protein [Bacteriovoracaceae bacterium]